MLYGIDQNTLVFLTVSISLKFIDGKNLRDFRFSKGNRIKYSMYGCSGDIAHLSYRSNGAGIMQCICNKSSQPGSSLEISGQKTIVFIEAFTTGTDIAAFSENKITMLHLKGQILNRLHSVVMDSFGESEANWTDMLFGLGFQQNFHIRIRMNNFFNNYIFNI